MYQSPKVKIIKFNQSDIIVNLASSGELVYPIEVPEHGIEFDYE